MAERRAVGCIVLFAKSPVPGRVKTRLQPALTAPQSAAVARALVEQAARALQQAPAGWSVQLRVDDPTDPFLRDLAHRRGFEFAAQGDGDLGARMARTFDQALQAYRAVIIVGSDCTGLDPAYLNNAVAALGNGSDAVLGPAADGGYVLVGLRRWVPGLFDAIAWSTPAVLATQRARLAERALRWRELPLRADVDRVEDLWMLCPGIGRGTQALVIARLSP